MASLRCWRVESGLVQVSLVGGMVHSAIFGVMCWFFLGECSGLECQASWDVGCSFRRGHFLQCGNNSCKVDNGVVYLSAWNAWGGGGWGCAKPWDEWRYSRGCRFMDVPGVPVVIWPGFTQVCEWDLAPLNCFVIAILMERQVG